MLLSQRAEGLQVTNHVAALERSEVEIEPEKEVEKEEEKPEQEPEPEVKPVEEKAPETPTKPDEKPQFTETLEKRVVQDGQHVELNVKFTGYPWPEITWTHNNEPILPSADFQIVIDMEHMISTLIIIEVFPEDQGVYSCVARNPLGEDITTCELIVEGKTR